MHDFAAMIVRLCRGGPLHLCGAVRWLYLQHLISTNDLSKWATLREVHFWPLTRPFAPKFGAKKRRGEKVAVTPVHADVPASWTPPGGVSDCGTSSLRRLAVGSWAVGLSAMRRRTVQSNRDRQRSMQRAELAATYL